MFQVEMRLCQYSTIFDQEKANVAKMLIIVEVTEGYIGICYTIQISVAINFSNKLEKITFLFYFSEP